MREINKELAKKFFDITNKQELIDGSGHAIYSVDSFVKWGELIELLEDDIKHLEQKHFSGNTHKSTIYSHATGERLDYLVGIDNKDFLRWFGGVIGADLTDADYFYGRGRQGSFMADRIFGRLQDIAEINENDMRAIVKKMEQRNREEE